MKGILEAAIANPWAALRTVLDGPLHPGGEEATGELLDRAGVTEGTRLVDVGCGAGESLGVARARGADAVGVDRNPAGDGTIRGEMTRLPFADETVEVVLAECTVCLADDRERALAEMSRILEPGGRLALSDVVVDGELPALPEPIVRSLCLRNSRSREETVTELEAAGFTVGELRDHREELMAMRDRVGERVDYERLLGLLGKRGGRLLDGIETVETAVEEGSVGYVSLVARVEDEDI